LPITALRETPPSSSAIWLAVMPLLHSSFSRSMRSSVQDIHSFLHAIAARPKARAPPQSFKPGKGSRRSLAALLLYVKAKRGEFKAGRSVWL
jgi:hypothetical protein